LEPQVFELVGVVLEELEVVANGREDLVEFGLELRVVLRFSLRLLSQLLLLLRRDCSTSRRGIVVTDWWWLHFVNEAVLFGVVL